MPITWRIVKKKHQPDALTGEGARRYGGRWNSAGHVIIYTAETLSGALLEMLVHSNRQLLMHYLVYRINIPKKGVRSIAEEKLPANWQYSPAPLELARIGDEWHQQQHSLALAVPNSIVPMEKNYLINPLHKDFHLVKTEGPLDFNINPRLSSSIV